AARLYDGKSATLVTPGLVVVADGKLTGEGPKAAIPDGAEIIDLQDATLLPGLIDAHVHLTAQMSKDWKQDFYDDLTKTDAEVALDAVPYARDTLLGGFTTVRNVGAQNLVDIGLRNAIRDGK